MAWEQVKSFNLSKMGTKKGWCLQNVRLGFGITTTKYPSAVADMSAQRANGTLHPLSELPTDLAVPIYCDTTSKNEHVIAYNKGYYYENGKAVKISSYKVFGWGEYCSGTCVVKKTTGATNAKAASSFLHVRGYWKYGDTDPRIGKMAEFMYKTFPAYTNKKALGDYFGLYLRSSIKEFQKRTKIQADGMVGPVTYAQLKKYGFKG